ncbi:MAG: hypothetical protein ABI795_02595 [Chthoniobacterales bacterium]
MNRSGKVLLQPARGEHWGDADAVAEVNAAQLEWRKKMGSDHF